MDQKAPPVNSADVNQDRSQPDLKESDQPAEEYKLGLDLINQNDYEEAIKRFSISTQINDEFANGYNGWGRALALLERHSEATEKFRRAISCDEKHPSAYYNLAASLYDLEKYDEIDEVCRKAIEAGVSDPDIYNVWGLGLSELKQFDDAIKKYEEAVSLNRQVGKEDGRAYYNWGFSLAGLKQYGSAIEKFEESIRLFSARFDEEPDLLIQATYARHSIAELYWRQGKYKKGREQWDLTRKAYLATKVESQDAEYFYNLGSMLQSVLLNFNEAETAYQHGLKLDPEHVGILTNLVTLHIEKKDSWSPKGKFNSSYGEDDYNDSELAGGWYWKARDSFVRAKKILEAAQRQSENPKVLLQLGQLYLALGSYLTTEESQLAEECLLKAYAADKKSFDTCANLGVLYARAENYEKAVRFLSDAVRLEADDLTFRSNLAEAHLKAESMEKAESEYRKILNVTACHVESHIGLGEVYKAMGDSDEDPDMYYRAIQEFSEGLRMATTDSGSKKLLGKSLAAAHYSRGYARVKLYELSKLAKDGSLLNQARTDFKKALESDRENYKANRALEKLGKRFGLGSSQRFFEKAGPWILFLLSFGVFLVAQISVVAGRPIHELNPGYYVLLTFGALIWMVASICLPQLLKIKVAGIELEKNAVEQITTPTSLGISK